MDIDWHHDFVSYLVEDRSIEGLDRFALAEQALRSIPTLCVIGITIAHKHEVFEVDGNGEGWGSSEKILSRVSSDRAHALVHDLLFYS